MKNRFKLPLFGLILFGVFACGGGNDEAVNDVSGKKQLLAEKKEAVKVLEEEIDKLKAELLILDPPKEKEALLVKTIIAEPASFNRYTDVQASVISDDMVFASSELGGRIVSLNVKEGQYVKKGSLIAKLDMQSVLDQKAELETGLSLAKDIYERQSKLWEQKIGTELQFLQAKNSFERMEKSLQLLETQLKKANVYAPISGVIEKELLQAGEVSAPGSPIVQMFNPNQLIISADVPENYLGKIKRGERVEVKFPALDISASKVVTLVGRTIDPSNRTFKVELNTDNMGGRLKPNLLAEISFNDFSQNDVIIVPLELLQEEVNGNKYVYVSRPDAEGNLVAHKSYVTTGESSLGEIVIETGLSIGDKIITEGARSVSEGVRVQEQLN